jgi:uncharacterized protein (TIGR01370 family)
MMGVAMPLHADSDIKWLIVYSNQLNTSQLKDVTMAIVESDVVKPTQYPDGRTRFYAYVSVGETENTRAYWKQVRDSTTIIEKNPDWPNSYRVDIRSPLWRSILTDQVIPEIVKKKFSGIFLDTIDVPLYLEERNPKKFARSTAVLVQFIHSLKKKFPQLGIIPNNGLSILHQIGKWVDGVVVEDVYTRYDFETKSYDATPVDETTKKEDQLDRFISQFKKPVYVVLYGNLQSALIQQAITRCREKGYHWYVGKIDLMTVGTME